MVPKTARADCLREVIDGWREATVEWAKATLALAKELFRARQEFRSNVEFGLWLVENDLDYFNKDDRAALINMGQHAEITRRVLEETDRRSLRLIWQDEIEARLLSVEKTGVPVDEPQKAEESTDNKEENLDEHHEEDKKVDRKPKGALATLPNADLVLSYITNARMRSNIARLINKRKGPIWDLLVESLAIGAFGEPTATEYATLPNLRLVLPWCPPSYAKKYDLTKKAERAQIQQDVFPVVIRHQEELARNPARLPILVQELYRARQVEREEKRREQSISKMPHGQQKIVAFGETIWPRINDAPFSYDELCLAIWFFNFTISQLQTQWDAKSKALQIQQMLKWLTPICRFPNWPTAVRKLCALYSANPGGLCECPPPPANFGIT
jgi:hypothetical protein